MKSVLFLSLFLVSGFSFLVTPSFAQTQDWKTQQSGRCVAAGTDVATIQGFECLFFNVLQVIVFFAGLAFLFMFISGGFRYLFSGGEQKALAAASSTLTMAIIGLIGIIASWLIISFIQKFTGINITDFKIPGP